MKRFANVLFVGMGLFFLIAGCEEEPQTLPAAYGTDSHTHSDGSTHKDGDEHTDHDHGAHNHGDHDHGDHDHDHSVEGHSHGEGPHGGVIVDWGGGTYHLELVVDHAQKSATVYVLGSDEKTPTPISASEIQLAIKDPSLQLTLLPEAGESGADQESSVFSVVDEQLDEEKNYEGSISGLVDGTPYSGCFKEDVH